MACMCAYLCVCVCVCVCARVNIITYISQQAGEATRPGIDVDLWQRTFGRSPEERSCRVCFMMSVADQPFFIDYDADFSYLDPITNADRIGTLTVHNADRTGIALQKARRVSRCLFV